MPIPDEIDRLFRAPNFAIVATLEPDGSPQTSIVWVTVKGDAILFSTLKNRRKFANLVRDPRVSILVQDPQRPYEYIEVRGTATISEDRARELADELSLAYADRPFRKEPPEHIRVVVRITVDKALKYLGGGIVQRLQ